LVVVVLDLASELHAPSTISAVAQINTRLMAFSRP